MNPNLSAILLSLVLVASSANGADNYRPRDEGEQDA